MMNIYGVKQRRALRNADIKYINIELTILDHIIKRILDFLIDLY